jgi:2-polyprenyl-6-methoxyphenol hydroxylase-like FAD-dependent oxidoreductase
MQSTYQPRSGPSGEYDPILRCVCLNLLQDTEAGRVTTANGSELSADVIVGADGIHSVVRPFVVERESIAQPVGESAYRFLLRPQDLQAIKSPLLKDGQIPPTIHTVIGDQRRIIAYPCRGGEVFNCAALIRKYTSVTVTERLTIVPPAVADSELHETTSNKWSAKGDIDALIKAFEGYGP